MNWVKGFALVTCLATSLSVIEATSAAAAPAADPAPKAMTDAEKNAKAADCSKQADAKKLHGEARKKFREECKGGVDRAKDLKKAAECSKQADAKKLHGEARKKFREECKKG